jgi:acyl-CoA synthetase (AMP-forming)/AMP-acid ligase II
MNVGTFLTKSAKIFPENIAIKHGKKVLTYSEFNKRVNKLANALNKLNIKKGDNVAILQYNYPETLESIFACFKAGIGAVPINFRLHPKEFSFIIDNSESRAVIISEEFNESFNDVKNLMPKVKNIISISKGKEVGFIDYEELIEKESDVFEDVTVEPDDLAWLFYTSGTTGNPKGAMLTHRNMVAMSMNFFADMCPIGPDDAILHAAPISHGSGIYSLPNIAKAAKNVILASKSFNPELVFKTIEEEKITNMFAAPTMIKLLIDSEYVGKYDFSSMKSLIYGGGPMYVEDLKDALNKLGNCLVQLYGQGECPMTISYLSHRDHKLEGSEQEMKRLGSAGIPRTDVEIKIFDENDNELSDGEVGEVVVRSDIVMKGYWKNSEATAKTMSSGWLHTGDVGYIDTDGYLYLLDRSKDMIISGGENVYPREIEEVILKHPAIKEVAVIGVPDEKWGETIKAIVSLNKGYSITEEEIINFCADNIARYKRPRSVEIIDDLPKNNYGKILKRELRDKYWKDRDKKI